MYTGCAPPAAPAVGNNRRPLPAIGGRFGLRPVSSYTVAEGGGGVVGGGGELWGGYTPCSWGAVDTRCLAGQVNFTIDQRYMTESSEIDL